MDEKKVDIFVIDDKEKKFSIEAPKSISYFDFQTILVEQILSKYVKNYYIVFKGKKYDKSNQLEILEFEEGDTVVVYNNRDLEKLNIKLHTDPNLNEGDMKKGKITGFLRLILIKYISNFINNINLITSEEIRGIVSELASDMKLVESPEEDIKSNLMDTNGNDIIAYSKYVCSVVSDQDINNLLELVDKSMRNQIDKYWSILSKYEIFNKDFEKSLFQSIENSYFDYSLIGLSIYQQSNRENYLNEMKECPNIVKKYLFHGTQIDPISNIITKGFLYSRKPFYGMGIYFSETLDYVSFYCGGDDFYSRRDNFGKVLSANSTFSCVGAEIYYDKEKLKNVLDFKYCIKELNHFPTYEEICKDYSDKKVEKYGVHFIRVEPNQGQVRTEEDIIKDKQKGKFIGTEYCITEKCQILPLYGLTFKRNEYFVLWKDPNFSGENCYSEYLLERKLFIYKYAKMNAYFESSTERALEIIKRKRFNKIILISNIGLDLSGKKFVEIARQILGFNVLVLFFSNNQKHFSWLQNFPNALYTNDASFYKDYILNYNSSGLLKLKSKIEKYYDINLKFTDDYLQFPKFINQKEYNDIIFDEPNPNFKKVIIKNSQNNLILCIDEKGNPCFKSNKNLDINSYTWYVTMIDNEITFYSNNKYLGANIHKKIVTGEQFMKIYKFEKINDNEYIFYYDNKNNVLTINGNNASIQNESYNKVNQSFKLIEQSYSL